ncbi:MAG TPA: putative LPS assembly protein LptD [Puia sp.]|nr:putative LPS assembly protein LptD [Puia sp.]
MHENSPKISLKFFAVLIFEIIFFFVTSIGKANYSATENFYKFLTSGIDTVPLIRLQERPIVKDTSFKPTDTITDKLLNEVVNYRLGDRTDTFNVKFSKDTLDAPINYSAADSIVLDVPTNIITLYNNATAKHKDLSLDAYKIEMDQQKQLVTATYTTDTANKIVGKPKMTQTNTDMEADSIIYNMKTGKGITRTSYTKSGEMFVYGQTIKKVSPDVFYALRGRFTTCNLDTPHYAFRAKKMKVINGKMAISGPIHPEIEGVPLPIYLPFGFFPITEGRHSGLIAPEFVESPNFGLGLQGLGYYKVLSQNFDVKTMVNLYSYGGWNLYLTPTYKVRYHYSGQLNFSFQDTKTLSSTGKTEFDENKTFNLSWSHSMDSKARPGTTFTASVNIASSKFNQYVYTSPTANFTNSLNSSINYSKTWNGLYNLTLSASHNQNSVTRLFNVNLPNVGFTATTIYPFQKKEFVGAPKWYEKLGIGLSSTLSNQTSFYDTAFNFKNILDTMQYGAHHSLPITLSLPQLGALQIAPGVSFQQNWYSRRSYYRWDPAAQKIDTSFSKGFFTENSAAFSLSLSTAIFGTFTKFSKDSKIAGIHHVIRPTISLSYSPNLAGKDYYTLTSHPYEKLNPGDTTSTSVPVSYYNQSIYGPFANGRFGGISFGLDNSIEIKVRSKTDTANGGLKKIKIIDGFGFTGSYNYLADSFKLSPFQLYFRSTLFEKINITGGATVDPYETDSAGFRRNIYAWNIPGKGFSLGRITNGNIAISTTLKSAPKDQKKDDEKTKETSDQIPMTPEEQQAQLDYIRNHPGEFADFNIAWSLNLSYSLNYTSTLKPDLSGFSHQIISGLNWSGDFNLTEKWKVSMNSFYDVTHSKINALTMSIARDLHCWQMSINVTPIGLYRSFSITISPKAGILRDLHINKTNYFTGGY